MVNFKKRYKLLHILTQLNIGGAEIMALKLIEHIEKSRFLPFVVSFTKDDGLLHRFKKAKIPVLMMEKKNRVDVKLVWKLRKFVVQNRIDIVHTHNYQPWLYAGAALLGLRRVRLIHTEHSKLMTGKRVHLFLRKLLTLKTHKIVCVSDMVSKPLIRTAGIPNGKIDVVHNGVDINPRYKESRVGDLRKDLGIPKDGIIIGSIGRLVWEKDYEVLIRAFRVLLQEKENVYLVIVGDGEKRESLEKLISELNVGGRIFMTGFKDNVNDYLKQFDVFTLSSIDEGLPLALLEAMTYAIPVVCTKIGGMPEVISEGVNGYLVEPRDHVKLAKKLSYVLSDPKQAEKVAANGYETVKNRFSLENMVNRYQEIYVQAG